MGDEKCVIAVREAIKKALEVALDEVRKSVCKEEDFEKAILEVLGKFLGVEANPTKCELILEKPVTESVCRDFYEQRRWVMCRAHRLMKEWIKEGKIADLGEALDIAWDELKKKCAEAGYAI